MPTIGNYKGIHSGPVVLLANGETLLDHVRDLPRIACPVIGLNQSWQVYPAPLYHVTLDYSHYKLDPAVFDGLKAQNKLFTMGQRWTGTVRIPICSDDAVFWCWDLEKDGAKIGWQSVGSVAFVTLQLAVYMGFDPIYFVGLDLGGEHFHKRWKTNSHLHQQDMLFRMAAKRLDGKVKVLNAGSPNSRCTAFPLCGFDELPLKVAEAA